MSEKWRTQHLIMAMHQAISLLKVDSNKEKIVCRVCNKEKPRPSKGGNVCQYCLNKRKRTLVILNDAPEPYRCPGCGYKITTSTCVLCRTNSYINAKEKTNQEES